MMDPEQRLREFLKHIAEEQNYNDHVAEIKQFDSDGANYTSQLFGVTLAAPGKADLKLFAKVSVLGEKLRSISPTPAFEIEKIFYTKLVPKYTELQDRYKIPVEERLIFAKYYGSSMEYLKEILVLEDMTNQGYRSFDRLKCYDWNYAAACVRALAKLHALSVAYEHDDPDDYNRVAEVTKCDFPIEYLKHFMERCIATAIQSTEEINKARVEKFLVDQFQGRKFLKYYRPDRLVILQHGDFRPSNILQKTDEDGELKLVFVDHQLVHRGNPMTDLLYFLISGSDEEFRAQYLEQYFEYYYAELSTALAALGIEADKVYKKKEYDKDVKELLPFGLSLGAFTLPVITVDASKAHKPKDGLEIDNLVMEVSDLFPIRFNGLVRDYIRMGLM